MRIGIAGGGLIGSLLAWRAGAAGAAVEMFDSGEKPCSAIAAGMIGSAAELPCAAPGLEKLGQESMRLWRTWLGELEAEKLLGARGTLLSACGRDLPELDRLARQIAARTDDPASAIRPVGPRELAELEPELAHLPRGYYLPGEGAVDAAAVLPLLRSAAVAAGARWHTGTAVGKVSPGALEIGGEQLAYDWACDCRGLGARDRLPLRAVRGEIIRLRTTEVAISRPVRLVHPRHPLYVVPRSGGEYLVGATEIESDDPSPISVRSVLELLGAAYALHPGFAEARIVDMRVGLRPALPDNTPALSAAHGLLSVNGMYRHGFLAGPALVRRATRKMGLDS